MHAHYSRSNLHHLFMDKARGGQWLVTVHRSSFSFRSIAQPPLLPLLRFPRHIRAQFSRAANEERVNTSLLLPARTTRATGWFCYAREITSFPLFFSTIATRDRIRIASGSRRRKIVFHSFTTDDYSRSPWNITDVLRLIKIRCNWYTVGDNNLLK